MSQMRHKLDAVIEGIEIGLGSDDCLWSAIESASRVLKLVKELGPNLVGLSEEDFESMVIKAINGETTCT